MERVNVVDALGNWSSLDGPLYRRLATAIREAVGAGFLPAGRVLPPERAMAKALAIGRSTVVAAYDLLREEGVLESRQGSGTWVSGAGRGHAGSSAREALQGATPDSGAATIDLATASLPAADAVSAVLAELPDDGLAQLLDRTDYSPLGIPELRAAVAALFTRQGLETGPHQVLITTGDQQALWLLVEHGVAAGDLAVVEDPTSAGLLDLLHARSATVRAVPPVAGHGPRPVVDVLGRTRAALVYLALSPSVQGRVCRPEDLPPLAAAVGAVEGTTVEDTAGRDLCFDDPPPLLARQRGGEDVVTVGSMSKLFWSGLRVGWVRGDAGLIRRLGRIKARADLGTPLLSQFLAVRLLQQWEQVRRARVAQLRADLDAAAGVLAAELPELEWTRPAAGVSVWLRLPGGTSAPFGEVARRHGVAVVPASSLSPGGGADDQIRLTYARPPEVFTEGVRRLRAAWEDYRRSLDLAGPDGEPWPV